MQIINWDKNSPRKLDIISKYSFDNELYKIVRRIIQDVAKNGDCALRRYTKKFDEIDISPKKMLVTQGEVNRAYEKIDVKFVPLLIKL